MNHPGLRLANVVQKHSEVREIKQGQGMGHGVGSGVNTVDTRRKRIGKKMGRGGRNIAAAAGKE